MVDQKLTLVYEGEVNQTITKAFTSLAEKNLGETEDDTTTKKRVYHVMVECLQNICKHADDIYAGKTGSPGTGIFLVGQDASNYTVTTGNVISNDKIAGLQELIDTINKLEPEELKVFYRTRLKETRLSDKAGAGLGFIDIARKTGNKIGIHFEPINDKTSFFIIKTTITRNK